MNNQLRFSLKNTSNLFSLYKNILTVSLFFGKMVGEDIVQQFY